MPLGMGRGQNLGLRDFAIFWFFCRRGHPCFTNTCLVAFILVKAKSVILFIYLWLLMFISPQRPILSISLLCQLRHKIYHMMSCSVMFYEMHKTIFLYFIAGKWVVSLSVNIVNNNSIFVRIVKQFCPMDWCHLSVRLSIDRSVCLTSTSWLTFALEVFNLLCILALHSFKRFLVIQVKYTGRICFHSRSTFHKNLHLD